MRVGAVMLMSMLLYGCAQQLESLHGGDKDTTPPVLQVEESFGDRTLRFEKQNIELFFDEYIQVKNPVKEVVITPPLTYLPRVKSRGKKLILAFDEKEVLRDSTTYTIDFGKSIVDLNEGNPLSNLRMTFSTGDYIDSMRVSGKLHYADREEISANTIVAFYLDHQDSIVVKDKPLYFTRPDKEGVFDIQNMKVATYKVVAFDDVNLNLKYDEVSEAIGFIDSLVTIADDTTDVKLDITLSGPPQELKLISGKGKKFGKVDLLYNMRVEELPMISASQDVALYPRISKDSVLVYYRTELDSFELYANLDTVQIKVPDTLSRPRELVLSSASGDLISPLDAYVIRSNLPIEKVNKDSIILTDTSGAILPIEVVLGESKFDLQIKYDWLDTAIYNLSLRPAALVDLYGNKSDSLDLQVQALARSNLGSVQVVLPLADSTKQYILEMYDKKRLMHRVIIPPQDTFVWQVDSIPSKNYRLEVLEDKNGNGKWDPANYWQKTQAELTTLGSTANMVPNGVLQVVIRYLDVVPPISRVPRLPKGKAPLQKVLQDRLGKDSLDPTKN